MTVRANTAMASPIDSRGESAARFKWISDQ